MGRLLDIAKTGSMKAAVPSASPSEPKLGATDRSRFQPPADTSSNPEAIARLQRKSAEIEQRFSQPHARLFPFLGRKVRTPSGPGTLLQVFADRVTVLLEAELSKCSVFKLRDVEPVSGEWDT
jgi:hypothetical protein